MEAQGADAQTDTATAEAQREVPEQDSKDQDLDKMLNRDVEFGPFVVFLQHLEDKDKLLKVVLEMLKKRVLNYNYSTLTGQILPREKQVDSGVGRLIEGSGHLPKCVFTAGLGQNGQTTRGRRQVAAA